MAIDSHGYSLALVENFKGLEYERKKNQIPIVKFEPMNRRSVYNTNRCYSGKIAKKTWKVIFIVLTSNFFVALLASNASSLPTREMRRVWFKKLHCKLRDC